MEYVEGCGFYGDQRARHACGAPILDLNYEEDKLVTVDFNLVATEEGEFVEVQGSGEEATFSQTQLDEMLSLGRKGITQLIEGQRAALNQIGAGL